MLPTSKRSLTWVTVYAIAMGVLEGAVVVYLRKLYYPHGFGFPLAPVDNDVALIEAIREAATVVMLAAIGVLAGRSRGERFSYFLYAFGLWDLIYYVFLKAALGWPASLMTWDILFLLPVPWVGPVLTPCLLALVMMLFGVTVVHYNDRNVDVSMTMRERALLWVGALVVIVSFTIDWLEFEGPRLWENIVTHQPFGRNVGNFVPGAFRWWIFLVGFAMILASYSLFRQRLARTPRA